MNELYHHGILGMKWGVRRFQNSDGTLTEAGKKRYRDVTESNTKQKLDTSTAKYMLSQRAKRAGLVAVADSRNSRKEFNKANRYMQGTSEYEKHSEKSRVYAEESKKYSEIADRANELFKKINDGQLKAGRDFIIQRDLNVNLTKFPGYAALRKDVRSEDIYSLVMPSYLGYNEYRMIMNK